jgi:threonine dehydrogenase-like Zn-dependent dehydrogenase
VGVLLEPLTIAEKALRQVWDVQERLPWTVAGSPQGHASGQRAVVLGSGPVGLLGALALLGRGFETWVYSRDVSSHPKARWVESVGAHHLSSQDVAVERLREHLGAIDLVYEATGAAAFSFRALEALGPNGVFIFTGVPGRKAPFELQGAELMRRMVLRNQLVFGTVNAGPDAFEQGIADLALFHARWPAALRGLITQRAEPEQVPELLTGERAGIKQVVRFAKVR